MARRLIAIISALVILAIAVSGLFLPTQVARYGAGIIYGTTGRGASVVVAASDAPGLLKAQADYVATGTNDQTTLSTAISALTNGGKVFLSQGNFYLSDTLAISTSNVTIGGTGIGTVLHATSAVNSANITGSYITIEDLTINGSSNATSLRSTGSYIHLNRIYSHGHTVSNLLINGGNVVTVRDGWFYGVSVNTTANDILFDGNNFNGDLTNVTLSVDGGASIRILNNTFESYAGTAIAVGYTTSTYAVTISDNYFETAVADTIGYGVISLLSGSGNAANATITGNYVAASTNWTARFYAAAINSLVVKGNYSPKPIWIASNTMNDAEVEDQISGITFNSLTGLKRVNATAGKATIWSTAAPTVGTWQVGDRTINTNSTSGNATAWVCVTAGTPGTWKAESWASASGATSITATETSKQFAHGLATTPTYVSISPTTNATAPYTWWWTANTTNITVNLWPASTDTFTFRWTADLR